MNKKNTKYKTICNPSFAIRLNNEFFNLPILILPAVEILILKIASPISTLADTPDLVSTSQGFEIESQQQDWKDWIAGYEASHSWGSCGLE